MLQDIRFALRLLARTPGTTVAIVLALGLGIGFATAIFNTYSAVLLRPLPHISDEHRLVFINSAPLDAPGDFDELSMPDFLDLREQATSLEGLTTAQGKTVILQSPTGEPERLLGVDISAAGPAMLGVPPVRGRLFLAADAAPDAPPVALISHTLWQRRYGGAEDVIGRVETFNGVATTIIGVLPLGFGFPENSEVWMPMRRQYREGNRDARGWDAWARLREGVTLAQAQAELDTLGAALAVQYPDTNAGIGFVARLVREEATDDTRAALRLMLGSAACVLLIACANVANLLLARSIGRGPEFAIRMAMGASRSRLGRQLVTESLLLSLGGGAAGLLIALWANELLIAAIPAAVLPFWIQMEFDRGVFGFAAAAAGFAALACGLLPAWQAARHPGTDLKEGGRTATGSRRTHRLRHALVVAQIALSTVLLIAAGLFFRSFHTLRAQPLGFDPSSIITFRVGLPQEQFSTEDARRFFPAVTQRLAETPGVIAVGATSNLPGHETGSIRFLLDGQAAPANLAEAPRASDRLITAGYLSALRIPVRQGRDFAASDHRDAPGVCLVDETFARRWFANSDPIGRRLRVGDAITDPNSDLTVVGVVGDAAQRLDQPNRHGAIYRLIDQSDIRFVSYAARVEGDPAVFARTLQSAVLAIHPGVPIYHPTSLEQALAVAHWDQRFLLQVFGACALGALGLASLGVYAVMSYTVARRTPEIGVRMALGASEYDILRLVGTQGLSLVGTGLVAGLVIALGVSRLLASLLFGVSPSDPLTFLGLAAVLTGVGLLACWFPARRAARINPTLAMRVE